MGVLVFAVPCVFFDFQDHFVEAAYEDSACTGTYGPVQREEDKHRFLQDAIVTKRLLFQCLWKEFDQSEREIPSTGQVPNALLETLLKLALEMCLLVRVPRHNRHDIIDHDGQKQNCHLSKKQKCSHYTESDSSESHLSTRPQKRLKTENSAGGGAGESEGGDKFLVPWLLQSKGQAHTKELLDRAELHSRWSVRVGQESCKRRRFEFVLGRMIPPGFFSRLQAQLYRECNEVLTECAKDVAVLSPFDSFDGADERVAVMVRKENFRTHAETGDDMQLVGQTQYGVIDVIAWNASAASSAGAGTFALCDRVLKDVRILALEWKGLHVREWVPCPHCCETKAGMIERGKILDAWRGKRGGVPQLGCSKVSITRQLSTVTDMLLLLFVCVSVCRDSVEREHQRIPCYYRLNMQMHRN